MRGRFVIWFGVIRMVSYFPHDGIVEDVEANDLRIDVEVWAVSPRGAGWLFGEKVATEVRLFKLFPMFSFLLFKLRLLLTWNGGGRLRTFTDGSLLFSLTTSTGYS